MKQTLITIGLFVVAVFLLVGCAPEAISSSTGTTRTPGGVGLGSTAHNIPFTTPDGKETSLHKVHLNLMIIAFTRPEKEGCDKLTPQLTALAKRFESLPITVVQVAVPIQEDPHHLSDKKAVRIDSDFITLCDDDRTAWKAYGKPPIDTAFLVDENHRIDDIANLDELSMLAAKAEQLGEVIVERYAGD